MTLFVSDIINSKQSNVTGHPVTSSSLQWRRNGEVIENAVASQYSVVSEDEGKIISVTQTATSFAGTSVRASASVGPVLPNPSNLFARNEQGAWYDPGDFNRYMQTGPELITNGDFSNGTIGWNASGATLSSINGKLTILATTAGVAARATQTVTSIPGKAYLVAFKVRKPNGTGISAGSFATGTSAGSIYGNSSTEVGRSYVFFAVATTTIVNFEMPAFGIVIGDLAEFDNISVRELTALSTATLFQDSVGTTPVTDVEQQVGLMLDKRLGLVLGPELRSSVVAARVGSGSAATATYNTMTGQGTFERVDVSNQTYLRISGLASNRFYRIRLTNTGPGDISIRQDTINSVVAVITPGTTVTVHISTTTFTDISIVGNVNARVNTCTVLAINELPGNHAFQTAAIDRPILRNRYNLLTKTEQFDDSVWFSSGVICSPNSASSPSGEMTADKIIAGVGQITTANDGIGSFRQTIAVAANSTWSFSFFAKSAEMTSVRVREGVSTGTRINVNLATGTFVYETGSSAGMTAVVTPSVDGWWKITVSRTTGAAETTCRAEIKPGIDVGNGTSGVYVWGASLVPANQAHLPYQRVNTATDYDSDPSKFPLYLAANGTNTWMQTNSIDFTATDKVTVFAGVRKLSDAGIGILTELSGSTDTNAGVFLLSTGVYQTATPGPNWTTRSKGSATSFAVANVSAAPVSNVITLTLGISNVLNAIRVNGALAGQSTSGQGTGNFGNHPLYLFRRGGTALPFNGNFYGLIIRGNSSTQTQIELTERWMAKRTSVTLS